MFVRKIDPPAETAATDIPPANSRSAGQSGRRRRAFKLIAAIALLGAGLYAVLAERGFVASNNAVVSAYVVSLRAPIGGFVSGLAIDVGSAVHRSEAIARLDDPYVPDQHMVDLQQHLARVRADRVGTEHERASLLALAADLARRAEAHRDATRSRLTALVTSAEQMLAAKVVERDETQRTLERKRQLGRAGFVSPADLERAETAATIAARETETLGAQLLSERAQMKWADSGVLSDPAGQDVTYSAQRADEIAIRLAAVSREIAAMRDDENETEGRLAAETQRLAVLRHADILAPLDGTLWRLATADGERVAAGDLVAEVVDCRTAFLVVAVPQDRVPDIVPDGKVRFRLLGETIERHGRVQTVMGAGALGADRHLAAAPAAERNTTATVLVRLDHPQNGCLVGRSARVLLPADRGGLGHLFDRFR